MQYSIRSIFDFLYEEFLYCMNEFLIVILEAYASLMGAYNNCRIL